MKTYFKVLKQYADFSGRARRQEFWMFQLFNIIFALAWIFIMVIIFAIFSGNYIYALKFVENNFYISYSVALMLPSLALAVRRMHDLGKSGWTLLLVLIPIVGQIWLFVLMLTGGQNYENRYGPNPKTTTIIFDKKRMLKSASIVLIVAAGIKILTIITYFLDLIIRDVIFWFSNPHFWFQELSFLLSFVMIFIAGINFLNKKSIFEIEGKARKSIFLIFISVSILFIINVIRILGTKGWSINPFVMTGNIIHTIMCMSVALFTALILFSWQNKNLLRKAAIFVIIITSVDIMMKINFEMFNEAYYPHMEWSNQLLVFLRRFGMLLQIAFIVLAATFLAKESTQIADTQIAESETIQKDEQDGIISQDINKERVAVTAEMNKMPQIKKPSLLWVIIGFVVTFVLFATSLENIDDLWYLFVFFIVYDIGTLIMYFDRKKVYNKMLKESEGLSEDGKIIENYVLNIPATIKVVRESSFVGAIVQYKVYLNNEFVGKIKNGKTLEIKTSVSHNIVRVFDNNDNPFAGNFTVDLQDGGSAEVFVKAGRFVKS